jgi:hypothetical protein
MYDHTHQTLEGIAQLRNGLGLTHSQMWDNALDSEFNDGSVSPLRMDRLIVSRKYSKTESTSGEKEQTNGRDLPYGMLLVIFVLITAIAVMALNSRKEGAKTPKSPNVVTPSKSATAVIQESRPSFNAPQIAAPRHGTIARYSNSEGVAPLEINTSYGEYYFIKLENAATGATEVELFINGGRRIEIEMPLGTYIMKYAAGTTWYGREHLFGPETSYSEAGSTFKFTQDYSGYSGYTVTLYKVANGNMTTKSINASDF